jgi:hypothetical protein
VTTWPDRRKPGGGDPSRASCVIRICSSGQDFSRRSIARKADNIASIESHQRGSWDSKPVGPARFWLWSGRLIVTQLRRSGAPSPRSSLRLSAWGRSPSPAKKSHTGDGFYLGRAQVHGGMRLCTSSCRTCYPTNDASPCRNVLHSGRRLEAASSYPRTTVRGLVPVSLGKPKLF